MTINDAYRSSATGVKARNASPNTSIATVTPVSNEVSVQTQSLDAGQVILYDTNENVLDRVPCNSGAYEDTSNVGGTAVEFVAVAGADAEFSAETITVNDDTGGTGTDTTVDVNSDDAESQTLVLGSGAETGAAEVFELGATTATTVYREVDSDGDGTWETQVQVDVFNAAFHSQGNALVVSTSEPARLKVVNTGDGTPEAEQYAIGMEVND